MLVAATIASIGCASDTNFTGSTSSDHQVPNLEPEPTPPEKAQPGKPSKIEDRVSVIGIGDDEIDQRVANNGGQLSEFRVSLAWNNVNDLDLHIETPTSTIFFQNPTDGIAELDVDMNAVISSPRPVENIIWEQRPPAGQYTIIVDHYRNRGGQDPTSFKIKLTLGDHIRTYEGTVSRQGRRRMRVAEFTVNPQKRGADQRLVTAPSTYLEQATTGL